METKKAELSAAKEEIAANQATLDDGQSQLDSARAQLSSGRQQLEEKQAQLNAGQAEIQANTEKLTSSQAELDVNEQKLLDGEKEIRENEQKLKDAKKDLEDAKKKLSDGKKEYQDGKKEADDKIAEAQQKIEDAQKEVDDIETPEWIVTDRNDLPEYSDFGDNAERLKNIGKVFPILPCSGSDQSYHDDTNGGGTANPDRNHESARIWKSIHCIQVSQLRISGYSRRKYRRSTFRRKGSSVYHYPGVWNHVLEYWRSHAAGL